MKILIAEDSRTQRHLLKALLEKAGHEVVEVSDGAEAWQILERDRLRLVITDWEMPNLNGPDLIQRVRAKEWPTYTYILLLTSKEDTQSVVTGLQAGADDYLTKPFDRDELMARLGIGERILGLEARLAYMADHDQLTGLFNRRALYHRVHEELARAAREQYALGVILVDIDHFKAVNDTYGHAVGDQALKLVASLLNDGKRPYDSLGRWGGEEFLLLLPGATLEQTRDVAERLRLGLAAAPLALTEGGHLSLTASFGVSSAPGGGLTGLDVLLQKADQALYHAKEMGRNRVCISPD